MNKLFFAIAVIGIIGYFFYQEHRDEKDRQSYHLEMEKHQLDRAKTQYSLASQKYREKVQDFYSKAFSLESYTCDQYNYSATLKVRFTNRSNQTIEGVQANLKISTKLNTTIADGTIEMLDRIRPNASVVLKYGLGGEICKYKINQLKMVFSIPTENEVLPTKYGRRMSELGHAKIAGESPIIVFSDGFEIHKHQLRETTIGPIGKGMTSEAITSYKQLTVDVEQKMTKYFN
jgi:hypothetical protein